MKITVLIENRPSLADARLKAEWGLSLHIAFGSRSILLDTGASGAFSSNARILGIDPASVDALVLSHYHYDHTGGLGRFLEENRCAKVYLADSSDGDCTARVFGLFNKYIGPDTRVLKNNPERLVKVLETQEILPGVHLLTRIMKSRARPAGNKYLYLKKGIKLLPDDFSHELVLVLRDEGKLVICTGCSHSGILNMIDTAAARFPGEPVKAVIGGFHFSSPPRLDAITESAAAVEVTARSMLEFPVGVTFTGHCTGDAAFSILQNVMGSRLQDIRTGSSFIV